MIIYWRTLEKDATDTSTIPQYMNSGYLPSVHFARNIYWESQVRESGKPETIPQYMNSGYLPSVHFARNIYWESQVRESGKPQTVAQYIASDYFMRGLDIKPITWDGWLEAKETYTYASANTITVTGDQTTKYPKGSKIKLTNDGSIKMYYVENSEYSSPNTTITLSGESDLANATITNPYYSYMECPAGFKDGKAWYRASAYRNGNQTLTETTTAQIEYNVETYDPNSNFDSYQYTVPITGIYNIQTHTQVQSTNANQLYNNIVSLKNGSTLIEQAKHDNYNSLHTIVTLNTNRTYKLIKGDTINNNAYIDTADGNAGWIIGGAAYTSIVIQFIGV